MYCPHSIPQARGAGLETVVLTRPMDSRLEHINFSLLFSTLSPRKIIQIFSSLLLERRVILCANSLSLLSGCAHALLALLYPFEWQVSGGHGGFIYDLFIGCCYMYLTVQQHSCACTFCSVNRASLNSHNFSSLGPKC